MITLKLASVFLLLTIVGANTDYELLPHCLENHLPGLVLVSTIDGKFSALNSEGKLQWQIDTDPGPLLVSNIHNLELTNSGKWIRIIPSLTGCLYRFDGSTIDPISITADSLLRSSFKYSDDLIIAGGLEVRTYGIGFRSGKIFYTCSTINCVNITTNENESEDLLLLERSTQIVRAVETLSGNERWNFSVGQHNIKSTQVGCSDTNAGHFNWNVTAIIPDGLILASQYQNNVQVAWQYQFTSPIVKIWKWDGRKINEVDLFQFKSEKTATKAKTSPALYLGMHKRQLYIHESDIFQHNLQRHTAIAERQSVDKIPWKPISATGLLSDESTAATSVLYSSEYVNGNGYYLYSDPSMKKNDLRDKNKSFKYPELTYDDKNYSIHHFIKNWWKEAAVIVLTTILLFNFMFRSFSRRQPKQVIFVERPVEIFTPKESSSERLSESSDSFFTSRYLNDFDTLRCLGKGGFGVVFEVKQKIDECNYAIKRILLPAEKSKKEAVMREVKALAKLEHHNIVRYFNSWVEQPPYGWQLQYDNEWIKDTSDYPTESTNQNPMSTNKKVSIDIQMEDTDSNDSLRFDYKKVSQNDDSFIVFDTNEENTALQNEESVKTDIVSYNNYSENVKSNNTSLSFDITTNDAPSFLYIQMQLCQKQSLREWLVNNKERHLNNTLNIFKQILSAVEYVHLQGLIHRDLKPSNIFFSLDGQIKVGDFGLVKDEEEAYDSSHGFNSLRGHTRDVGTRLYMSPEQLNGLKYNYKVDIYSLGLIFFELLVYFSTDMERIRTITDLRDNKFPQNFVEKCSDEHNLLEMMLCQLPEKRLTTFGIRARPPLNNCDNDYNVAYDFELPKSARTVLAATKA